MVKIKIGDLIIEKPVIMAPMAGVTDFPYRQILRKMGCELLFTEMVSSKGLVYGSQRTEELTDFEKEKSGYIGIQLFGAEPEIMAEAAQIVEKNFKPDLIDINMGCPTPKIVKNGSGSALMKEPELAGKVIKEVVNAVDLPVTVKIRRGWDQNSINGVEIASIAEENGAQSVAVHGRTREQFYSGEADWEIISDIKNKVNIPVIGNGDVFTPESAKDMLDKTGCDGVMVARGIQGNPWLLKRSIHYIKSDQLLPEPDYKEKIDMALYHLQKAIDYFGEETAIPKMRKHISWYLKGMPYSSEIKNKVNKLNDQVKIEEVLKNYVESLLD